MKYHSRQSIVKRGAMTDRDRKAWEQQQRSNRIIDKAQAVFFARGYEKTTLPAIADAAGYNKRTLYLYFKDKEELFLAVALRGLIQLRTALAGAIEHTGEPGGLHSLARAFYEFSVEYPEFIDLIMTYESRHFVYHEPTTAARPRSFREQCQAVSGSIAELVTKAIEKEMEAGTIRKDLSPRPLMLLLWGQIFGVMKILRMRRRHFEEAFGISRERLFDHFVAMVDRALTP